MFFCVITALLETPAASVSLKMEATHSFVTLVMTQRNKLYCKPDSHNLNFHCHENLTCHVNHKRICNITHRLFQKCVWEKHIIQTTGSRIPGACGMPGKFTFFLVAHQKLNKELQFIMRIHWLLKKCRLLWKKCTEDVGQCTFHISNDFKNLSTLVPRLYNDAPQFRKDFIKPLIPFLNLCICIKCTFISFCIFKILICIFHSI